MIRHILFSSNEAFKLNEFVLRAERYMPAPFDLIIDCKGNDVSEAAYDKVISE